MIKLRNLSCFILTIVCRNLVPEFLQLVPELVPVLVPVSGQYVIGITAVLSYQ